MRPVLAVACAVALSASVGAQQAPGSIDERARVVAVADSALAAISRKDFVALSALMLEEGRTFSVRERQGQIRYASRTRAEERATTFDGTIVERGWDPTVHVSGPLAIAWVPYDLYVNGQWSHCGVDTFTLLLVDGRWRIATLAWSVEQPPACTKHPAGPPDQRATLPAVVDASAFDPARLARIDSALQQSVDSSWIAGAVALVLRDGKVVYERAVGWSDREARRPMTTDAIFRIASQSKAITSTAVMMLVEEGRIALGDPVSKWIPSFARTTVAERADTGRTLTPARRAITIFDLLTHTAGISYGTDASVAARYTAAGLGSAAGFGWYTADKDEPICTTMDRLGTLPFVAQPGERWVYGYNTDILGCVVERASGKPLDEFIRTRITEPLGMRDTRFFLPREQRDRLAAVYRNGPDGRIVRADTGARGQGHYVDGPRRSFAGGAGLLSTARDYATFLQAILEGGALGGTRLLSPRSVELMTTNQVGTRYNADGQGHGLAFATTDRLGANGFNSVGTFSWGGAYATAYQVDPSERLVMVLMYQNVPNNSTIRSKWPALVYQALVRP